MLDKHITRLVKSENGEPRFETLSSVADVIKLAGRGGAFNLEDEFGISAERVGALDRVTQFAIGAGLDALRDAGIPLVMRYKTTTKGTQLPERWGLPDSLRDDTGCNLLHPLFQDTILSPTRWHVITQTTNAANNWPHLKVCSPTAAED
jgi:hypothetical protein